jgi:hypothetical protein
MSEQPPLRGDRQWRNEVVRLSELTVNTSTIAGQAFSNCRIIGPAILALLDDVTITHCTWDAPGLDAIYWEVPPEREVVIGVVGVSNCVFSNCTFENVGIAGPRQMRAQFEGGFRAES